MIFSPASRLHQSATWHTEDIDVDAYLKALNITPATPSYELLARIHKQHVKTFPFTDLEVALGEHLGVDPATVQDQLMTKNRGGLLL